MSKEEMTLEKPASEPVKTDEVAELIGQLDRIGVRNAADVTNIATAAAQAGKLANMLGEERNRSAQLQQQLQELALKVASMSNAVPQVDEWGQPRAAGVDLGQLVKNAVRTTFKEEVIEPQLKAKEQFYQAMNYIQNDDDYTVVKDIFEKHVSSPKVQQALGNQETNIVEEYNRVVKRFYRGIAEQSRDVLKKITDKGGVVPGSTSAPFMEQGVITAPPQVSADTKAELRKLKEKSRGRDDDIDAMLRSILKDDDPILRR